MGKWLLGVISRRVMLWSNLNMEQGLAPGKILAAALAAGCGSRLQYSCFHQLKHRLPIQSAICPMLSRTLLFLLLLLLLLLRRRGRLSSPGKC
jgi:hypothetical protein